MPESLTNVCAIFLNSITHKWQCRFPKRRNMWTGTHHRKRVELLSLPAGQYRRRLAEGKNADAGFGADATNLTFYEKICDDSRKVFGRSIQEATHSPLIDADDKDYFVGNALVALMTPLPERLDVSFLLLASKQEAAELDRVLFTSLNRKAHWDITILRDYPSFHHGHSVHEAFRQRVKDQDETPSKGGENKERDQKAFDQAMQAAWSYTDLVLYFYGKTEHYQQSRAEFLSYFPHTGK